jgi:phosphopantothenoylcysteine synthetase/decarboxylase
MKILITSGGTKVNIDPVRYIGNMSSGTMGRNIALSAMQRGHHIRFLTSRNGKTPFSVNINLESMSLKMMELMLQNLKMDHTKFRHRYEESIYDTYDDYEERLTYLLENESYDAIILCAAVSDYGVVYSEEKMRSADAMSIPLVPTKKLIPEVMKRRGGAKVVGFKLVNKKTVSEVIDICESYLEKYGIDMMVGNDIHELRNGEYYNVHVTCNKCKLYTANFSDEIIKSVESL